MTAQFVKTRPAPVQVEAARWLHDDPTTLPAIYKLVMRGSPTGALTEVPVWRLLLIRTAPPDEDPFYELVNDGDWLVYDPADGKLTAWDDDAFHAEYQQADRG
jgi:hypothetical protein